MPKPPITSFSSVAVNSEYVVNNNYGFYAPQLTTPQRNSIPANFRKLGGIVYNSSTDSLNVYLDNANNPVWATIATDVGGYVRGPVNSVANNIAVFADNSGKVIGDSGVSINQVPAPLDAQFKLLSITTPSTNRISNLGYIQFTGGVGSIYVDSDCPVHFVDNGGQASSVFTGGIPQAASSVSALVELQSSTGVLLLSRLTGSQITALTTPVSGMVVYNTDNNSFQGYVNGSWKLLSGGGNVTGPTSSTNNHIATFNGTTGALIQDSGITILNKKIGIGTDSPAYALQMSNTNGVNPLIYMSATSDAPFRLDNSDGIYSVWQGKPAFSGDTGNMGTIVTAYTGGTPGDGAATIGKVTLSGGGGIVTINTTAVQSDSYIFLQLVGSGTVVNNTATVLSINAGVSFNIYYSMAVSGSVNWLIVNPGT
jgi:hypothetical protein